MKRVRSLGLFLVILLFTAGLATAPTAAQTKITMIFPSWQWGQPGYDDFFRAAIAEFEKRYPNVSIQPVPIPLESYADQLIVRFSAKNPPEIVQWTLWDFHTFAEAGFLDPLDDRLKGTDILQTWVPAFLKFTQVRGKQYGVMLSGASVALMYNKRMFRAAGLEVPTTPREFVEAAKKLTLRDSAGRIAQYGLAMVSKPVPEQISYGIGRMITGLGGSLTKGGKPAVHSREVQQAIAIYKELLDAGAIPKGLGRIEARQFLWEGKAAMLLEGPWVMTSVMQLNPRLLPDIGVAPIPFPVQISNPSNGLAIARDQKHQDIAWEFIKMVTSPEWMRVYGELTGVIPGRTGAVSQRAYEKFPWIRKFAELAAVGRTEIPEGLEAYQNQMYKIMADRLADVLFGSKSVEAALTEIQTEVERVVKTSR